MTTRVIRIAEEFTDAPGGRYISDGPFSGEQFRKEMLEPALAQYDRVILIAAALLVGEHGPKLVGRLFPKLAR